MPLGSLFVTVRAGHPQEQRWILIHKMWCLQWENLRKFTAGLDTPELYTERALIGLWGSALNTAYPGNSIAVIERPVVKSTTSGTGLLDLWMAIEEAPYVFDYGVEAKPHNVHMLNATKSANKIFGIATTELAAAKTASQITKYRSGATAGVISCNSNRPSPTVAQLDAYTDALWNALKQLAAVQSPRPRLFLATHKIQAGTFSDWKGRKALGVYTLFVAQ